MATTLELGTIENIRTRTDLAMTKRWILRGGSMENISQLGDALGINLEILRKQEEAVAI